MLQLVKTASEITSATCTLTRNFPEDEQYILVPTVRDHCFSILENASLGMARFDVASRQNFLTQAIIGIGELKASYNLCKSLDLISSDQHHALIEKTQVLRDQIKMAQDYIATLPPDGQATW